MCADLLCFITHEPSQHFRWTQLCKCPIAAATAIPPLDACRSKMCCFCRNGVYPHLRSQQSPPPAGAPTCRKRRP